MKAMYALGGCGLQRAMTASVLRWSSAEASKVLQASKRTFATCLLSQIWSELYYHLLVGHAEYISARRICLVALSWASPHD